MTSAPCFEILSDSISIYNPWPSLWILQLRSRSLWHVHRSSQLCWARISLVGPLHQHLSCLEQRRVGRSGREPRTDDRTVGLCSKGNWQGVGKISKDYDIFTVKKKSYINQKDQSFHAPMHPKPQQNWGLIERATLFLAFRLGILNCFESYPLTLFLWLTPLLHHQKFELPYAEENPTSGPSTLAKQLWRQTSDWGETNLRVALGFPSYKTNSW